MKLRSLFKRNKINKILFKLFNIYFNNKIYIILINLIRGTSSKSKRYRYNLASTDPVAIDKACYDLIVKEKTDGSNDWKDWADERLALNTVRVAEKLGIGTQDYNLIDVDKKDLWYVWYLIIPIGAVLIIALIIIVVIMVKKRKNKEKLMDEETGLGSAVVSRVVSTITICGNIC